MKDRERSHALAPTCTHTHPLRQERWDLLEEHQVLAVSFQQVSTQLEQLRHDTGTPSAVTALDRPSTPALDGQIKRMEEHEARLSTILAGRPTSSPDAKVAKPAPASSAKLSLEDLERQVEACVAREHAAAAQDSVFREEITRLSAECEERKLQARDAEERVRMLETELDGQNKKAQKAAADMYAEMDRLQGQVDTGNVEVKRLLTQLQDAEEHAKTLEARSNEASASSSEQAAALERKLLAAQQDAGSLGDKLAALQASYRVNCVIFGAVLHCCCM